MLFRALFSFGAFCMISSFDFGSEIHVREPWLPNNCPDNTTKFLKDYGYLPNNNMKEISLDDVKTSLWTFQWYNHLNTSAECDAETVEKMEAERCGCEDIVQKDDMKKKMMMRPDNMYGPLEYRIGNTKWDEMRLTWRVSGYPVKNRLSRTEVDLCMARALQPWSEVTPLVFQHETNPANRVDIDIKFLTGRHTSRPPYYDFDGPGKVLAHAFFPQSGVVHFDDDENFVIGSNQGTELCIVAAHEFGHTLGISHSNVGEALMAPYYRYMDTLKLHQDDIDAAQAIYGKRNDMMPTRRVPFTTPPTTTRLTTSRPRPTYCDIKIEAAFKIGRTTFIFSYERPSPLHNYRRSYVYRVDDVRGLDYSSRKPVYEMFKKMSNVRGSAYPWKVDAATYFPDTRKVFLFRGNRVYRYQHRGDSFLLDNTGRRDDESYPRWMSPEEFPEWVRAALPFPYGRGSSQGYYLFLFGDTMTWEWKYYKRPRETVGAWAYPLNVFGQEMPMSVDATVSYSRDYAYLFRGDKIYRFNMSLRRMDDNNPIMPIGQFFKAGCE